MSSHKQDYERAAGIQHTRREEKPDNRNILSLFAPTIIGLAYGGCLLLIVGCILLILKEMP